MLEESTTGTASPVSNDVPKAKDFGRGKAQEMPITACKCLEIGVQSFPLLGNVSEAASTSNLSK